MDRKQDVCKRTWTAALLSSPIGAAQAYAVPPMLDPQTAALTSAQFGALLWAPLLVLMLMLLAGLAWAMHASRARRLAGQERERSAVPSRPPVRLANQARPLSRPRRWRRIPAAAH